MSSVAAALPASDTRSLRGVHALLTVQSIVIVLLSVNRLSELTAGYVAPNQFLRWVDLNNMLVLPLVSLVASYLLKRRLEAASPGHGRAHLALGLLFVIGVYLLAAGYGDHEVTNYLHSRFCADGPSSELCRIIIFNDDQFSHWVFFAGFTAMNAAILLLQALAPRGSEAGARDAALLVANGLFIGAGVFANLAFEQIGLDLYVVATLALLACWLLWRRGPQPLTIYYAVAYGVGLVGTGLYKALAG
jgi:hypothetical protein